MLESEFQSKLIKELEDRFEGCVILKNDPNYIQGIPDLLVLHENKWVALECKKSLKEKRRPNQEYYIDILNKMSYASFICPENKEEVLNDIQSTFESERSACFSRSK